jgi:trimethylamine--corrinoid protein Co-methyltransferase
MLSINKIFSDDIIQQIIDEALQLLESPGVKIGSKEALGWLHDSGATIDLIEGTAKFPPELVLKLLGDVPEEFSLYNTLGEATVHYAGEKIHFDPGSSAINILDSENQEHRPAETNDLIKIIQICEALSAFDAQSTAVVCHDVPGEIGDLYRLYLVLLYSKKPIVTGAFSVKTGKVMFEMLEICAGNSGSFKKKPRAIFDVCPSPPLNWTEFAAQNLIDLARAGIPAQIVSMPLSGAAAPVTLIGSIVQHTAECLSGITIHQLANPGAPIVWGGAPALFDMRYGTTSVGAAETMLMISGYAQVGKYLNIPTHAYLVASDAKSIDAQAGIESGISAIIGALSGINMISGAGMLDFLACQSPEKLVIDAEAIEMAKRYTNGIHFHTDTLGVEHFSDSEFSGDFLRHQLTRKLYKAEQYIPSGVIDRGSLRNWMDSGAIDIFSRAKRRVEDIISTYNKPALLPEQETDLTKLVSTLARDTGMNQLPKLS